MARKNKIDAFGAIALIVFSASLGLNQALVKLVNEGMAPVFQAGMRSLIAFPAVALFVVVAGRRLNWRDGSLAPGLFTGVLFAGEFMLLFIAVDYSTIARVSVIFYTMPIWVAFGAHFLIPGEALTKVRLLGLTFAVAGVALAFADGGFGGDARALTGDLMALVAATFWAAIALIARTTALSRSKPEQQLLYQLCVSAPILLGVAFASGETFREFNNTHILILLFQSIAIVGVGFMTWFWILTIYPASDMASFSFLAPVFGVIAGWLIFHEPLTPMILGALVLVGAGIVLVNRKPKPG